MKFFSHSISNPHWLYGSSVCISVFTLNLTPTLALWCECGDEIFSHSISHPHWLIRVSLGVSVGMKFFHTQSQTHTGSMVRVCVCLFSHSISNPHWLYGLSVCISVFALKPTPTLALWCEFGNEFFHTHSQTHTGSMVRVCVCLFSHSSPHPHWPYGVSVGMKFFHTHSHTHTGSMVRVCISQFSHSSPHPQWPYGVSLGMNFFTLILTPTLALWGGKSETSSGKPKKKPH